MTHPFIRLAIASCIAYLAWRVIDHALRTLPKRVAQPTVYEPVVPIVCEYPDDHEFWEWYGTLIANVDITYEEARKWYAMREHKDVAQMTGEPMTAGQDEQT